MPIVSVDGHSFDDSLLNRGGWVLDVGARGFAFSRDMALRGMNVIPVEPDPAEIYPGVIHAAIVADPKQRTAMYAGWSTGEGNHLAATRPSHASEYFQVNCLTVQDLMVQQGIERFDLVKLDCEGSEYEILWHWPKHAALQISVEFHDFLGRNPSRPNNGAFYEVLFGGPLADYEIVQHVLTPLNPANPVMNYWDSLFQLKPEFR